jgi:hypothetical protein
MMQVETILMLLNGRELVPQSAKPQPTHLVKVNHAIAPVVDDPSVMMKCLSPG